MFFASNRVTEETKFYCSVNNVSKCKPSYEVCVPPPTVESVLHVDCFECVYSQLIRASFSQTTLTCSDAV